MTTDIKNKIDAQYAREIAAVEAFNAANNAQCCNEGWDVFECDGGIQIQANDEAGVFAYDHEAWKHVVEQAKAGSLLHIAALELVDADEEEQITETCGWYK